MEAKDEILVEEAGVEPETTSSEPIVSIVALFDVLGFESRLRQIGLAAMRSLYASLVATVTSLPKARYLLRNLPDSDGAVHPALGVTDFKHAYFSDTIMLWDAYSDFFLPFFFETCCDLFREGLLLKLPLRGSIGVGPAILDKSNGTYLGLPLVDAARLEKRQRWLGVSFCDSFLRPPYNVIYPDSVIPYSEHFKEEADRRKPCLVLDWPRSWRDQKLGDIEAVISELNKDRDHEAYYANTLKFVAHSEQNQDWFRHLEVREPRPSPQQAP